MADQNSGSQESLEGEMDDALNDAAAELIVESGGSLDEPIQSPTSDQDESNNETPIDEESTDDSKEDSQTDEQSQENKEQEQITVDDQVDQKQTQIDTDNQEQQQSQTDDGKDNQATKDYKELQAAYTKSQQANKDQEARLAAMEQSIQQQQQMVEQQNQAALKPYQQESPQHQVFQQKKVQMDMVANQIRNLTVELPGEENKDNRDRMTVSYSKQFSDADWQMWQEAESYEQQRKQEFYDNPEKSFGNMIDQRLNNLMGQQQVTQQSEQLVDNIFNDPALRTAINADGGGNDIAIKMQNNIQNNMSVQAAAQIAIQDHEILTLKNGQQKLSKENTTVNERQRLMRDNANVQQVNPVTASTDIDEKLKARGIVPGVVNHDNRLLDGLMEDDDAWEESPTR